MEQFADLIVKRFGKTSDSHMVTDKVTQLIYPQVNYKILKNQLIPMPECNITKLYSYVTETPRFVEIEDKWDENEDINKNNANILGGFGRLETESFMNLPVNTSTKGNVKYYGAQLFNIDDFIKFNFNPQFLPVFEMSIGKNYVRDYIQDKDLGYGQYLEYHDNPHYHQPLNSETKGFIILGKRVEGKIRLSGFQIPWNTALLTPGGIFHNDANLIGNWTVVYSKTPNYSTVLLRDKHDNCTKIIPEYEKESINPQNDEEVNQKQSAQFYQTYVK